MITLVLLWVLSTLGEGALYTNTPEGGSLFRKRAMAVTILIMLGSSLLLTMLVWQVWLMATIIGLYRAVNGLRFMKQRLPIRQLSAVSLRAHGWLLSLQIVSIIICFIIHAMALGVVLLPIFAAIQLLTALSLLRASLQTWRHMEPHIPTETLTDKQLPSLSVLIPARNETDTLQRCLDMLVASDYPKLEIIVLDDNSTNRQTSDIIRGFAREGVRFIQGAIPDESHWLAKNQAYARLRAEACGELLLFCGVDALLARNSLRNLVEILVYGQKDMLSVLPLMDASIRTHASLLQPMRYYWEICLPRRFFKRPPVLSTCWLIKASVLDRAGGFEAVSRSITPEAFFARKAVVTDTYNFMRSNNALGVSSAKPLNLQYETSVRLRYPQLHRRLELVAVTTLFELGIIVGPIVGLLCLGIIERTMAYLAIWGVCVTCLWITYYLVAVQTRLNSSWIAWLLMPIAFVNDIIVQHISCYKYEFSQVTWKGRDVTGPVMRVSSTTSKS